MYRSHTSSKDSLPIAALTLQWHHMSILSSQITGKLTVCSTACSDRQHRNVKAFYYWSFVRWIHQWPVNRIWWLCLVPTSTTRFASDLGCRMAKNLIELYKESTSCKQWHQIVSHEMKNTIRSQILKTILDCMSLIFRPQYVWFLVHLYGDLIPNSSGQFAELFVYIIPLE